MTQSSAVVEHWAFIMLRHAAKSFALEQAAVFATLVWLYMRVSMFPVLSLSLPQPSRSLES